MIDAIEKVSTWAVNMANPKNVVIATAGSLTIGIITSFLYILFLILITTFGGEAKYSLNLLASVLVPQIVAFGFVWIIVPASLAGIGLPDVSGVEALKKTWDSLTRTANNLSFVSGIIVSSLIFVELVFAIRVPWFIVLGYVGALIFIGIWAQKFKVPDTLYRVFGGIMAFAMLYLLGYGFLAQDKTIADNATKVRDILSLLKENWVGTATFTLVFWVLTGFSVMKIKESKK